jgi:hypothetical protein
VNQLEIIAPNDVALAEHVAVIRALGKRVVGDVIEIGRRLADCRNASATAVGSRGSIANSGRPR